MSRTVQGKDQGQWKTSSGAKELQLTTSMRDADVKAIRAGSRQSSPPTNHHDDFILHSNGYSFTHMVQIIIFLISPCGRTDKLFKAEIWGDDKQRQKLKGIAVQPAGAKNLTYRSPSWGAPGDQTIKVSQLNWTQQQADGGQICLELDSTTDINSFCMYDFKTCWINFFHESLACCPLYPSSIV
ncbi:hypothetical protein Vafri_11957 [Volvox africanus]|uniref:Pherophorin domain-containing protein n=1 Tax=Volvox africanus TaxID=51714 RepID=A0A8J4F299_9CHLO|nr:hypothetical protein Vafri_11957 [Volvox africanus]